MSDEEIEYLGFAAPKTGLQSPVTGIVLNVEQSPNGEAHRLVFNRTDGSVVPVGRRPGTEMPSGNDSNSAMFRCAVVSRKHAKMMFSDNTGHAYIIDLNSHHGTHIRKPGQLSSRMLEPELPMILSDGDVITFGKTVGRNEECVRPVVVRVELLRHPATDVFRPLFVPSPASDKASSGRYGIYVSSGSSDEMQESDVDEGDTTRADVSVIATGATKVLDAMRNMKLPPLGPWVNLPSLKEVLQTKSRSHSPMDLESPPPVASPALSYQDDIAALDRIIFGGEPSQEETGVETNPQEVGESSRESSQGVEESNSPPSDLGLVVEKLKDDISKLHSHRRKYRSRFNANVHTISLKLADYDKRITELTEKQDLLADKANQAPTPDTAALASQMSEVQEKLGFVLDVDLPDLQAQVDNIDGELCDLTDQHDEMNEMMDKATEVTRQVQNEIQRLEGFLAEIEQLRQKARGQVEQALREVQETSENAMKKIAEDSAKLSEALSLQSMSPSLKRKREDSDEGDDVDDQQVNDGDLTMDDIPPVAADESVPADAVQLSVMDETPVVISTPCLSLHRPRKRLRRIASVFAQTAGAVTVGAVVTWSALAFA
ncbi:hypothetical protein BKA70DRAFT_1293900 [Coprinopsis sp. MPI-PUGE-AT-0042]|nr:hypothetical protein BKA70DRAFT_1293900 [Coprinopsis sp. MPI-PUGE-AT-0042]